jgi:hypothetical protein
MQVKRSSPQSDFVHAAVEGAGLSYALETGKQAWNAAVLASADVVAGAAFRPKRSE